ncbi:hypothetical protein B0H11DRAFT_330552 [Mycena galericulata]|nr:hypothetical protein B0H11DRAFT_330552 [Mycena galericulata]
MQRSGSRFGQSLNLNLRSSSAFTFWQPIGLAERGLTASSKIRHSVSGLWRLGKARSPYPIPLYPAPILSSFKVRTVSINENFSSQYLNRIECFWDYALLAERYGDNCTPPLVLGHPDATRHDILLLMNKQQFCLDCTAALPSFSTDGYQPSSKPLANGQWSYQNLPK